MKAMILAAGRGERMRPLSDATPKPLLEVGGKPLIVWQIERLTRGGFGDIVINHARLGGMIEAALGDGSRFGARIEYSAEGEPLETAGGIAHALHLLGTAPFAVVSADIYTEFDYATLRAQVEKIGRVDNKIGSNEKIGPGETTVAHFVLTDNPPFHPQGDMGLADGRISMAPPKLNYGNIAVLHPCLFAGIPRGTVMRLFPPLFEYAKQGRITGEHYRGRWFNVGTPAQLAELDVLLRKEAG